MESDLLCFIPESLCSGFAEHIFKSVGCCAIILFQGVGVFVFAEMETNYSLNEKSLLCSKAEIFTPEPFQKLSESSPKLQSP